MNLVSLNCPLCGGLFQADAAMGGQPIGCPHCHGQVLLPAFEAPGSAPLVAPPTAVAPPPAPTAPPLGPSIQGGPPPPPEPLAPPVAAANTGFGPPSQSPHTSSPPAVAASDAMQLGCPLCQQVFSITQAMAGQVVGCPHCGGGVMAPQPEPQQATQAANSFGAPSQPHGAPTAMPPLTAAPQTASTEPKPFVPPSPQDSPAAQQSTTQPAASSPSAPPTPFVPPGPSNSPAAEQAPAQAAAPPQPANDPKPWTPPGSQSPEAASPSPYTSNAPEKAKDPPPESAYPPAAEPAGSTPPSNPAEESSSPPHTPAAQAPAASATEPPHAAAPQPPAESPKAAAAEAEAKANRLAALLPPGAAPIDPNAAATPTSETTPGLSQLGPSHLQAAAHIAGAVEPLTTTPLPTAPSQTAEATRIPTADGSYVSLQEPVKKVRIGNKVVELKQVSPEEKTKRRRRRTIIMIGFGLLILLGVLYFLLNSPTVLN